MDAPLIVVNFKTYSTALAEHAEALGKLMADVETSARMVRSQAHLTYLASVLFPD